MNMCAAAGATPTCVSAGAIITAAMMYDAVTGTARPSSQIAAAEYTTVRGSELPASVTMTPAIFNPRPVNVTTPTIMPAVAVVAATDSTPLPPVSSAAMSFRGHSAVSGRTKLNATASPVAQNTALNAVMPSTMKPAIPTSELQW